MRGDKKGGVVRKERVVRKEGGEKEGRRRMLPGISTALSRSLTRLNKIGKSCFMV